MNISPEAACGTCTCGSRWHVTAICEPGLTLEDCRLFEKLKLNKLDLKEHEYLFDSDIDNYAKFHTNFDYFTSHDFHNLVSKDLKSKDKNCSFSLLHTNIQSLLKNKDSLELLCNELDYEFAAIALTETWHNKSNKTLFNDENLSIPGYQSYFGQTSETKCGGSGFFISENLKVTTRTKLNKAFKNDDCEFDAFCIEVENQKGSNIILASIYNHPRKNPTEFLNYLDSTLKRIMKENKTILISGDFNIDLLCFEDNVFAENFVILMFSNFFQPLILQPTRYIDNARPTLIDNIFINSINIKIKSGNLISKISDHMPNFAILDLEIVKNRRDDVVKRNIKNLDEDKFLNDLKSTDFSFVINSVSTLEDKYSFFHNKFLSIVDKHAPLEKLSKRQQKRKLKPWITNGILKSIKVKNNLYKKFLKSNDKFWYQRYKYYRDMLNHLIRKSKRNHYNNYFESFNNNSKKIWKGINELIIRSKRNNTEKIQLKINNNTIRDNKMISNHFNSYFTSIAGNLVDKLGAITSNYTNYLKNPNPKTCFVNPVVSTEVSIIHDLDETSQAILRPVSTSAKLVARPASSRSPVLLVSFQ